MKRFTLAMGFVLCSFSVAHAQRQDDLDDDRKLAEANNWVYDDFDAARAEARKSGKPILAVIRCPP